MIFFANSYLSKFNRVKFIFLLIIVVDISVIINLNTFAQDSTSSQIINVYEVESTDTLRDATEEIVKSEPLDIDPNRGIFIITPDKNMQLRILGSIRYLIVYDNMDLSKASSMNTYQIPIGNENEKFPNYHNSLDQTRLGLEVTRVTEHGNVFIRLETDFAGHNGLRIRHAYGKYRNLLFGQTLSLFSQIAGSPATVDFGGPTGLSNVRTPQICYYVPGSVYGMDLTVALEDIDPELRIPDSLSLKTFQLIPSFSVRLEKTFEWGFLKIAGIIPFFSAKDYQNDLILKTGWGLQTSANISFLTSGNLYFGLAGGKAITSFINDLSGNGLDILFMADGGSIIPFVFGTYIGYELQFSEKFTSNLIYGMASIEKTSYSIDNDYRRGYKMHLNFFWKVVEGARIGGEAVWGTRVNMDKEKGNAFRTNLLVYYDF